MRQLSPKRSINWHTSACKCEKCTNKPTVIKVVAITQARQKYVLARCRCSRVFYTWEQNINNGNTKSCGCLQGKGKAILSLSTGHADKTYWHWLDGSENGVKHD